MPTPDDADIDDIPVPETRNVQPGNAPATRQEVAIEGPVVSVVSTIRRSIAERQEDARSNIAYILMGIFCAEAIFALLMLWFVKRTSIVEDLKQIMAIIFGPTAALVGSAIGFYFGTKSEESPPNPPAT